MRMVPAALLALLTAPSLAQEPRDEQRRVEAEIQKLEGKMRELVKVLREKGQERYAEKLEQGLAKLKKDAVDVKVRAILSFLEGNQLENALRAGEDVEKALEALLALLEDRDDLQEIEDRKRRVEAALQGLQEILKQEQKLTEETRRLDRDRGKEYERVTRDLDDLLRRQRELQERTESGPPRDLLRDLAEAAREIEKMEAEQKEIEKSFEAAKSKDSKDAGQFALGLDELIGRQERNKKVLEDAEAGRQAVEKTLAELDRILEAQKKAHLDTQAAARDAVQGNPRDLDRQQTDLNNRTWELGHDLFNTTQIPEEAKRKVLEPLADADNAQKAAVEGLKEGAYDLAGEEQERALRELEKARAGLALLKDEIEKALPEESVRVRKEQDEIQKGAQSLARSMKEASEANESPATAKALENAGRKAEQGAQSAQQAHQTLLQGRNDAASNAQQQVLNRLREARLELERLENALARKDQPRFAEPSRRQKDLSGKAGDLADRLNHLVRTPKAQRQSPEAQRDMLRATGEMRDAQGQMQESSARMQKGQSAEAQGAQGQVRENLRQALEALERARKDMEGRQDPDLKTLAEEQKKLEGKLQENVTKWLERKAKEERDEQKREALAQAAEEAQGAQGHMQQAWGRMVDHPPQPSQAGKEQAEARKKMEQALGKLDDLARRPLTPREREQAEELARKQAEVKQLTNELEKQLERMQRENARRSSQSAQGNMQQAQGNLQQGQPRAAEEDEEKALEDLEQARKEMEEALEELKRQAEEEVLVQIEIELKKMIEIQEEIHKGTKDLDALRRAKGVLGRDEAIRANALGKTQADLARTLGELRKKLSEEDVLVFRYVVESAIDDMTESAKNLREHETGERTQEVQADAARKMRELVDAFDIKLRRSRPRAGGGPGGVGRPPLVPDIVQLNMMKKLQEGLLKKTREVERNYSPRRDDLSDAEKTVLKRLSDEQGKLQDLMRKFIEKFERQKEEAGRRNPRGE